MNWIRVSKKTPCPICDHADYCRIGVRFVHCMRITSPLPSKCSLGGYLHPLNSHAAAIPRHEPPPRHTIDASGMMQRWFNQTTRSQYDALGVSLGVATHALLALKCAYAPEYSAWAWPMSNGAGAVVGIRLRSDNGRKWAVRGGYEGVFLPSVTPGSIAYLPEGPTSLAAILTLGKYGIGRPNCSGGIAQVAATLARLRISRAVILADNEDDKLRPNGDRWNPGLDGAKRLAEGIGVPCCTVVLPCKDAREAVALGMTSDFLESMVKGLIWQNPQKV